MVVWTGCRIPNAGKLLQIEGGGHHWPRSEALTHVRLDG